MGVRRKGIQVRDNNRSSSLRNDRNKTDVGINN
jgi:hypothetical protein